MVLVIKENGDERAIDKQQKTGQRISVKAEQEWYPKFKSNKKIKGKGCKYGTKDQ